MRHPNTRTSERVKVMARRILRDPTSSPMAKSIAACALTQAPNTPSKKAIKIVADKASQVLAEQNSEVFTEGKSDNLAEC